jgi:prepilin-type N-terminal cleavage/methylation domain-containing protein
MFLNKKAMPVGKKGFTLIEVLISIFILTTGIIAVLQAFPLGTKILGSSKRVTIASQLGQAKIEELISQSYVEISFGIVEAKHVLDSPFGSYQRETEIICVDPDSNFSEVIDCDPDPGIKKIEVTIFWKTFFGFSEKNNKIISLITKK